MARKKQPNPQRIKGKGEAWAYSKQKWIPGVGRRLKRIRKRKIRDLSLNPTLKEQFEADQNESDEILAQIRYTYPEQIREERERDAYNARQVRMRSNSENNPNIANGATSWPSPQLRGVRPTLSMTTIAESFGSD
jgi:hypothetical protein